MINELAQQIHENAKAHGFFDEPKNLELFARSREGLFPDYEYEGWDMFGNQVNGSIEMPNVRTNDELETDVWQGAKYSIERLRLCDGRTFNN